MPALRLVLLDPFAAADPGRGCRGSCALAVCATGTGDVGCCSCYLAELNDMLADIDRREDARPVHGRGRGVVIGLAVEAESLVALPAEDSGARQRRQHDATEASKNDNRSRRI